MALSIDDLGLVQEELIDVCVNSYDIGLQLKVPVGKLDSIKAEYSKPLDQLRETLKAWLKMATHHKWQTIADALRTRAVGEPKLASDIEAKYCQDPPVQASGQAMLRDTQMEALQQQVMALQQQLESKTEPQETVKRLEQKLREQQCAIEAMQTQLPPQQEMTLGKLIWQKGPKAPEEIYRGSIATDGTTVYCNRGGLTRVHQYHSDTQQWSTLPNLPYTLSSLVMADSKLTSVGGNLSGEVSDSLLSLTGDGRDGEWLEYFPPMTTKRHLTTAICHGRSLIVAGGMSNDSRLNTVEVLNMDTQLWSIASSLPHPILGATTSICGERLYLLGSNEYLRGETRSVLTCTISELLHSCQTSSQSTIWRPIANAPHRGSSCTTLCGQLVAVGGYDKAMEGTTSIFVYNESINSWLAKEAMVTPRNKPLVASLHDNTILVIGGCLGLDTVEIAKLS